MTYRGVSAPDSAEPPNDRIAFKIMELKPGARLGGYQVLSSLGAGGMGSVYRAWDEKLGRDVALKLLHDSTATDVQQWARLEREARALASLNHPNISTLYGFESDAEIRFLVMELVEGEVLSRRIAGAGIPIKEAVPLFLQVGAGLEAAHQKGIVHRDLKPSNIMVSADGTVKILDFGLAKILKPDTGFAIVSDVETVSVPLTAPHTLIGTVPYMSPELLRGRPTDQRTDIWAFGCLMYECLTGSAPFRRETRAETLSSILDAEPEWSRLPADTPESLVRLQRRCLRKDPHQRLQHVADARLDLEEALKRFSDSPCTAWARRGTSACTNAGGPMQAYSMDLRERALLDSDAGMKAADVAVKYRVSGSWVRLLKQRRRETGEVAPRVQRHGRRRMLEPHLHTLAALIAEQPDRTLAELKDALGTPASLATI